MKTYDIVYIDKTGDKQDYKVTATNVRDSIKIAFEQCPDARRIISSKPSNDQTSNSNGSHCRARAYNDDCF